MPRPVTQEELLLWYGYRNQIRILKHKQRELEESITARLQDGAYPEPGAHTAEIQPGRKRMRLKIY
jgi:hypothetical protein